MCACGAVLGTPESCFRITSAGLGTALTASWKGLPICVLQQGRRSGSQALAQPRTARYCPTALQNLGWLEPADKKPHRTQATVPQSKKQSLYLRCPLRGAQERKGTQQCSAPQPNCYNSALKPLPRYFPSRSNRSLAMRKATRERMGTSSIKATQASRAPRSRPFKEKPHKLEKIKLLVYLRPGWGGVSHTAKRENVRTEQRTGKGEQKVTFKNSV